MYIPQKMLNGCVFPQSYANSSNSIGNLTHPQSVPRAIPLAQESLPALRMPPVLETQPQRRERRAVQVGGRAVGFEAATKIILGLFTLW